MSHPSGWTIAKYNVKDAHVYMLWQGDTPHGRFDSPQAAMRIHTTLLGAAVAPDQPGAQLLTSSE
ncbi:hypothetical protein [Paraburkholderia aspalathi]|uniref:hypothetical protein n=1 Tax=Paraburkholderia aspalathi TaxID=1324617 RepID=UPI001BA70D55|nr:hypothetical protein [Paraburkholderia aspalathi]